MGCLPRSGGAIESSTEASGSPSSPLSGSASRWRALLRTIMSCCVCSSCSTPLPQPAIVVTLAIAVRAATAVRPPTALRAATANRAHLPHLRSRLPMSDIPCGYARVIIICGRSLPAFQRLHRATPANAGRHRPPPVYTGFLTVAVHAPAVCRLYSARSIANCMWGRQREDRSPLPSSSRLGGGDCSSRSMSDLPIRLPFGRSTHTTSPNGTMHALGPISKLQFHRRSVLTLQYCRVAKRTPPDWLESRAVGARNCGLL